MHFHVIPVDIVVINDCSTDNTHAVAAQEGVPVIDLSINLGIGGAVQTGILYAQEHDYDIALQVDADGQHNPSDIPLLIDRLTKDNADMVIGSRFSSGRCTYTCSGSQSLVKQSGCRYNEFA